MKDAFEEMCEVASGKSPGTKPQSAEKKNHGNILVIDDQLSKEGNKKLFGKTEFTKVVDELPFNFYFATGGDENGNYSIENVREAVQKTINAHGLHGILLDVQFGKTQFLGLDILKELTECFPKIPVIMMTSTNKEALVELDGEVRKIWDHCVIRGAVDYLPKTIILDPKNNTFVWRTLDRYMGKILPTKDWLIGQSNQFEAAVRKVAGISERGVSHVLILAETGAGKGGLARYLHRHGKRADQEMIEVADIGFSDQQFDVAFFGAARGAYTTQASVRTGVLDKVKKGVVFLNELGKIPKSRQDILLTVIDEQWYTKVGEETNKIDIDVQFVCATNANLTEMIKDGEFDEALFYRLENSLVGLPTLNEHREDIPLLLRHLLRVETLKEQKDLEAPRWKIPNIPMEVEDQLQLALWPGNVRQLGNFVHKVLNKAYESNDGKLEEKHFEEAWKDFQHSTRVTQTPVAGAGNTLSPGNLLTAQQTNQPAITLANLPEVMSALFQSKNLDLKGTLQELYLAEFAIHMKALINAYSPRLNSYNYTEALETVGVLGITTINNRTFDNQIWKIWSKLCPEAQQLAKQQFPKQADVFTKLDEKLMEKKSNSKGQAKPANDSAS